MMTLAEAQEKLTKEWDRDAMKVVILAICQGHRLCRVDEARRRMMSEEAVGTYDERRAYRSAIEDCVFILDSCIAEKGA